MQRRSGGGIGRRQLLSWAAGGIVAGATPALAAPASGNGFDPELDLRNLRAIDGTVGGRRYLLIVPRYQSPSRPIPLVVFLHGLGETRDPRLGAYAFLERYGLGSAWQRLKRAPIERTSKRGEWTDARIQEVNAELAERPFRGFAMACPFMPAPSGAGALDAYARWIEEDLVPRCREEARVWGDAARTHLCGVSLGGYVALELLIRLPHVFHACAGVQTAIGVGSAARYAERIAKHPDSGVFLLTSTRDPYLAPSEALAAALEKKKVRSELRVIPGPHDQPWLREAGTIEALHWLDRRSAPAT